MVSSVNEISRSPDSLKDIEPIFRVSDIHVSITVINKRRNIS